MRALALALRNHAALWRQLPAVNSHLVVALTLALVTLPQAVAFSVTLAGVPPHFGIYAAIWGVLFCALLNPSRVFHGGPNTAMLDVKINRFTFARRDASSTFQVPLWLTSYARRGFASPVADRIAAR